MDENSWGMSSSVDLYNCDLVLMNNESYIKKIVIELCDLIEMKRFGDCQVVFFGSSNKEGYSMFQLIETSNLSAHFANDIRTIYFDIFSCKSFNPEIVATFLAKCFKAEFSETQTNQRRLPPNGNF